REVDHDTGAPEADGREVVAEDRLPRAVGEAAGHMGSGRAHAAQPREGILRELHLRDARSIDAHALLAVGEGALERSELHLESLGIHEQPDHGTYPRTPRIPARRHARIPRSRARPRAAVGD